MIWTVNYDLHALDFWYKNNVFLIYFDYNIDTERTVFQLYNKYHHLMDDEVSKPIDLLNKNYWEHEDD